MQFSLNTPALERLLGGDSEIDIQARHQIVKAFEDKHLKQLAANFANPQVQAAVGAKVTETVREMLDVEKILDQQWPTVVGRLRTMINEHVDKRVEWAINESLNVQLNNRVQLFERLISQRLDAAIKDQCRTQATKLVSDALAAGMQAGMQAAQTHIDNCIGSLTLPTVPDNHRIITTR